MIAMTPVLTRGYTFWDRALLPADEFSERSRRVQAKMAEARLDGLVIWSAGYHTNGDLAYIGGWPMGGALLLPLEGEPTMFSPGGGRELYFQKMQTWVSDISSTGGKLGSIIADNLTKRGLAKGRLGMVGMGVLSSSGYHDAVQGLAAFELVDFDAPFRALKAVKRPREIAAVRAALSIAALAVAAGEGAFHKGASNASALVEAERVARVNGARDFRGLANIDADDLRPYERPSAERREPLLLWIAVDHHGYWADAAAACSAPAGSSAAQALDAMIAAAHAGSTAGAVADAAVRSLPAEAVDEALSYGLGGGIGLALEEGPVIRPGATEVLSDGEVLSLHVFARTGGTPSFAGAMVRLTDVGAQRLTAR